jgi:hypothetical protein
MKNWKMQIAGAAAVALMSASCASVTGSAGPETASQDACGAHDSAMRPQWKTSEAGHVEMDRLWRPDVKQEESSREVASEAWHPGVRHELSRSVVASANCQGPAQGNY